MFPMNICIDHEYPIPVPSQWLVWLISPSWLSREIHQWFLCSVLIFMFALIDIGVALLLKFVLMFLGALHLKSSGSLLCKGWSEIYPHSSSVASIQSATQKSSGSASDHCSLSLLLPVSVWAFVPNHLVTCILPMCLCLVLSHLSLVVWQQTNIT